MSGIAERLLLGSAVVDFKKKEVNSLTSMLLGMANHPRHWIRAAECDHDWSKFFPTFGTLEENGCEWGIFWEDGKFYARCLIFRPETETKEIVCAYGASVYEPNLPRKSFEKKDKEYPHLGTMGILYAHRYLDVFAEGILREFPLMYSTAPFLKAAEMGM